MTLELQLWLHISTDESYIVLVNKDGVQLAAGPLDDAAMRSAQEDEMSIPWRPGLADWVQQYRDDFQQVLPPPQVSQ